LLAIIPREDECNREKQICFNPHPILYKNIMKGSNVIQDLSVKILTENGDPIEFETTIRLSLHFVHRK
jgi:hypothetical protein